MFVEIASRTFEHCLCKARGDVEEKEWPIFGLQLTSAD